MGPESGEVVFLYTLAGTRSFRMTGCRSEDTAFTWVCTQPQTDWEATLLHGATKWLWPSPESEKITQDSNFEVRSWKIELKDRSKNCTGTPDLCMLPHDLWTQPVTYTPGVRWEAGSTGWCLWCTRVPDSSPEASPSQPCTPYAASQKHFGTCKDVL